MVKTIQRRRTTFHHKQELACKDELTLKVFIKVFTKEDLDTVDISKIRRCLDYMIDEPCIFLCKNNDNSSKETIDSLGLKHLVLDLKDLRSLSRRNTKVIFIIKNINKNIRKIIEIICKDMFSYSIIFV